jgi:hypothetical protein
MMEAMGVAIGYARYVGERPVVLKRRYQTSRGLLAFAAYNRSHVGFFCENVPPMICRKYAAIDDAGLRNGCGDGMCNVRNDRVARRRAGMAERHSIRKKAERFRDDGLCRHRTQLGIDQADMVAVVDQWPANREQAQRWQVVVWNPAADRQTAH